MTPDHIIPECYADTLLVEILLGQRIRNHKMGIGEVKNALAKNFKNVAAVGIIDNDKRKPTDFTAFELHEELHGIQLRRKADTKHTLLVICPAFEYWVFENAALVGIDPARHGFRAPKFFKNICKKVNASDNAALKQFLNTLKQKKAPGFLQLELWIYQGLGVDQRF